jgi:hypothetical protein
MRAEPPVIERTRALLLQAYPAVLDEVHGVPDSGWIQLDGADGRWGAFVFEAGVWPDDFPHVDFAANKACIPRTWAILSQLPGCRMVGLARVSPGVRVAPHTDPRPDDQIRAVLAVHLAPREHWWAESGAAAGHLAPARRVQ